MTTLFTSELKQSQELFGIGLTERTNKNGFEYQLFLHVVDILNSNCFAYVNSGSPFISEASPLMKRFQNGEFFFLKTEDDKIDNFPDFYIVRRDIVCIFDHFHIDASNPIGRNESIGTSFFKLLSNNNFEMTSSKLTTAMKQISFSKEHLVQNIERIMSRKIRKLPRYRQEVKNHIESSPNRSIAEEDGKKPKELWLLAENISPPERQYEKTALEIIGNLFNKTADLSGVIYVNCGYVDFLPKKVSDIRIWVK